MKKFVMVDGLLTSEECDYCINLFEESESVKVRGKTGTFIKHLDYNNSEIKPYLSKIIDESHKHFNENFEYGWSQIVYWVEGSLQGKHLDKADKKTIITSITYLNDDYEGGETFLSGEFSVKPKKGRTIFFHGSKYYHGVTQITKGGRYTLPIWYNRK
jgi:hypothetical protein